MISGLLITSRLKPGYGPEKVSYTLNPYDKAQGPIRAMQKFAVILMTTKGTDPLRPWFGTYLTKLYRMNVQLNGETLTFVRDQISSAIKQFFQLQAKESVQNKEAQETYDLVDSITVTDISLDAENHINVTLLFNLVDYGAVYYSILAS